LSVGDPVTPDKAPYEPSGPGLAAYLHGSDPVTNGRKDFVRQVFVALALMAALGVLCTSNAWAGVTCKVIATLCPPEPGHDWDRDRDRDHDPKPVPEPGTLALVAAGAGAVGAALRRRRNKP
jgi:hypothetical protein